ncbi:MAG: hypothetical protein MK116_09935 [Phycisphaerales bacterium]|nr:hypothetical protein [Phycisphaerales bacterium]
MDQSPQKLRQQMLECLDRLMAQRQADELRHTEDGTADPMRAASGQSALDAAVAQTEEIIRSLDRVLHPKPDEIVSFRTTCNGLSRLRNSQCA